MALTVDLMSRITSYVASGNSTVDDFLKSNNITSPEDIAEAKEYWNDMTDAYANLKPGDQITVPSDWS